MILYHYTSKNGFDGIGNTNVLMPSTDTVTDSTYGVGHYFTDLDPSNCDRLIALRCWENKFMDFKVNYYIKLDIPDYVLKYCRPNVYLVSSGAVKNFNVLSKGAKQICVLRPCDNCHKNTTL